LLKGGSITINPAQINHLPPAQRAVFVEAFSHALHAVFLVAVPFTVLAFVLSMVMKEIPLRTTSQMAHADPATPDAGAPAIGAPATVIPATGAVGVSGTAALVAGVPDP